MTDLIALLGKLVASDGTILVPGVDDMVSVADNEERYEDNPQLLMVRA
jgi:Cys-Gly metallodipeptidase DUG1